MKRRLNVSLDLGSDSLKIAFAYSDTNGGFVVGKFPAGNSTLISSIPSLAFFDDMKGAWVYADEFERNQYDSYVKAVRIRDLLSLLNTDEGRRHYSRGHNFPKFYFPRKEGMMENFSDSIAKDFTFEAEDSTPESVCEGFFYYIKNLVFSGITALAKERKTVFDMSCINIALVYPPNSSAEYIEEYKRLTAEAFSTVPTKLLSSTKALSMYAKYAGVIKNGDSLLVFDMGEEDISVAKAYMEKGKIFIDGQEGHSEPLKIGGVTVDNALCDLVKGQIRERETVGTPSAGDAGHIYEEALASREYLFMKSIKKAKSYLSYFADETAPFALSAPVGIHYEIYVKRNITRDDFKRAIGTEGNAMIAKLIVNYMLTELKMPLNKGLNSKNMGALKHGYVLLSGGLSETYSLLDFLRYYVCMDFPEIEIITLSSKSSEEDSFVILPHEDSAYSPAVGGALVALYDESIETVLSYSYCTWVTRKLYGSIQTLMSILVDRGTPIIPDKRYTHGFSLSAEDEKPEVIIPSIRNDEFYSTTLTREDISDPFAKCGATVMRNYKGEKITCVKLHDEYSDTERWYVDIGNIVEHGEGGRRVPDGLRVRMQELFDINTKARGNITLRYKGTIPQLRGKTAIALRHAYRAHETPPRLGIEQGIYSDRTGRVSVFYNIAKKSLNNYYKVTFADFGECSIALPASDFEIYHDGLGFDLAKSD